MTELKKLYEFRNQEEWLSICCTSPPLYTLDESGEEPIGICMHCRDNTTFELIKEEDDE